MKRRNFIRKTGLTGLGLSVIPASYSRSSLEEFIDTEMKPVCLTTWNFHQASKKAGELLDNKTSALDAVEQGVRVEEENIQNHTVGNGGAPDRDGFVTLDASIMGPEGDCGSVAFLQDIEHPVSVARKVMESTPHKMLVGKGAYNFAVNNGFKPTDLFSAESKKKWKNWLAHKNYKPIINIENHDTIGMLCLDQKGDLAGACTTSGLAYKMHGRVGDSPIIGSGLFVDNEVGGAVATGLGEEIMKNVSSFLIVEMMRQGKSPQESCEIAMNRLISKNPNYKDFQVAFLALNKKGEVGSFCIHQGFTYMRYGNSINENFTSKSLLKN